MLGTVMVIVARVLLTLGAGLGLAYWAAMFPAFINEHLPRVILGLILASLGLGSLATADDNLYADAQARFWTTRPALQQLSSVAADWRLFGAVLLIVGLLMIIWPCIGIRL